LFRFFGESHAIIIGVLFLPTSQLTLFSISLLSVGFLGRLSVWCAGRHVLYGLWLNVHGVVGWWHAGVVCSGFVVVYACHVGVLCLPFVLFALHHPIIDTFICGLYCIVMSIVSLIRPSPWLFAYQASSTNNQY